MKLFNLINRFRADEDGAVTVDWVVLTAAIVGLGIAVLTLLVSIPLLVSEGLEHRHPVDLALVVAGGGSVGLLEPVMK